MGPWRPRISCETVQRRTGFGLVVSMVADNIQQYYLDQLLSLVKNYEHRSVLTREEIIELFNAWADYWRYYVGVNVIPAISRIKQPIVEWKVYQDAPVPAEVHNEWKDKALFKDGMVLMMGKVWHRKDLENYYINGIDADNLSAINELLTRNGSTMTPEQFAKNTVVEQHKDIEKMHVYLYTKGKPLRDKRSDIGRPGMDVETIPAFEVKTSGKSLMCPSPSLHKSGHPWQILGTYTPITLNEDGATELQEFIEGICTKYGLSCNTHNSQRGYHNGDRDGQIPIEELFKPGYPTLKGHNRHERLLRMMDSLVIRRESRSLEQVKEIAMTYNTFEYFDPPLDDNEFEKQWKCSLKFTLRKGSETLPGKVQNKQDLNSLPATDFSIQALAEEVLEKHKFKTLKDTEEILHFERGIYKSDGEQIIKVVLEKIAGYVVTNNKRNEIIGHIKYKDMVDRHEFDKNLNIINVRNGLLNIKTGELKPHTPDYLSVIQLPVIFDQNAKCPNILKFLSQVMYPQDIFTAIEMIGYVLSKSNKYEKAFMLFGSGDNGKSVFIKLVESFVGPHNTSHVTLQDLDGDRFASADLYGKLVNTFADLPAHKLSSTGTFKTLVSGDSIRAQFKYGQPFSFVNRAKLIYSANKIPDSDDTSHAYYKRWLILAFEKSYTEGSKDPNLIQKLTTPEELSGLLNLALIALRHLEKEGGFRDIPVEEVKRDYERKSNTVKAFLQEMCLINLGAPEFLIRTGEFHEEYRKFCRQRKERPLDANIFGVELKKEGIERDRLRDHGSREYYYFGVQLLSYLRGQNQSLL